MEIDSSPVEIDQLRRAVDRMKMEELHLAKETDDASIERLAGCAPTSPTRPRSSRPQSRWEAEKSGLNRVGDLKVRLDDLRTQAERLQREGNYEGASRLIYGEIPALEKELAKANEDEIARGTAT
jgi:ATP-dependent Clp protease ATP-binding subunit ClpB